ncbi:MAG: polynucleotide adenylyltransferase PcnB [Burkholderiaceae bacterium]
MIRKLIGRLMGQVGTKGPRGALRRKPRQYRGSELGIRLEDVSEAALRTCETLQKAGHQAWIVGGGVRDLLLGLKPKDFDVATDASPEQVRALFRRSRIIGRRFRIVHVMFGREQIEVSTFRAIQEAAETDEHGRVLSDNVWGSQAEDAARRDFTINALYYDPVSDIVLDYHDGVRDLKRRSLRMIGDPATRFREDPVRMLRIARFTAKLGFEVEPATRKPIRELAPLLRNVPSARLFDETLKLLTSGHALACLNELRREGLHHGLLPMLDRIFEKPGDSSFAVLALQRTDERVRAERTISPGFLFATLLWEPVSTRWRKAVADGTPAVPALADAIDSVLHAQGSQLAITRRYLADMREIWMMQPRFERRSGRAPWGLVEHMRFRAGYDFLLLRCEAGELPDEIGRWWTDFQGADNEQRQALIASAQAHRPPGSGSGSRKRRRRSSRNQSAGRPDEGRDLSDPGHAA